MRKNTWADMMQGDTDVSQRNARVMQHVAESRFVTGKLHGINPVDNDIYIYITEGVGISHLSMSPSGLVTAATRTITTTMMSSQGPSEAFERFLKGS